jgi:hypothetical protein
MSSATSNAGLPRGIRNNNPGNIERTNPRAPWQGAAPLAEAMSRDRRFEVFESPVSGIRALLRTLITYQDKHGLKSVNEIINRWAPPVENKTSAYVDVVVRHMQASGVPVTDGDTEIDVHDYATALALTQSIVRHENGPPPKARGKWWYSQAEYDEALRRAGVVPKTQTPVTREPAVQAGAAAVVGGALTLTDAAGLASSTLERGSVAATVVGVLLIAIAVYAFIRARKRRKVEHEQ